MAAKMTPAARKARNARITARSAFGIGVVASLGANVMASAHTPVGIVTGLWAPIAFLFAMAMLENGSVTGKLAKYGVGALAAIAAWTSYWHLVEVFTTGGADVLTAHLLPLTVDVMMALAGPGMKAQAARVTRKAPAKKAAPVRKLRTAA